MSLPSKWRRMVEALKVPFRQYGLVLVSYLQRASLSRLLFTAFMLMWLVTAAPIFYTSFVYTEDAAFSRAEGDVAQKIELLASSFEGEYRTATSRSLKQIAASSILQELLSGSAEDQLVIARGLEANFLSIVKEHAAYQAIWYIDAAGREVAAVVERARGDSQALRYDWAAVRPENESAAPELVAGRKLYARISTTPALLTAGNMEWFMPPRDIVYEGPFLDSKQRWAVLAGMPILDLDSGAFSGTLIIQLNLELFIEVLRSMKGNGSNFVWLTAASDGTPLLKPEGAGGMAAPPKGNRSSPIARTTVTHTTEGLLAYRDLMTSEQLSIARLSYAIPLPELAKDFAKTRNLLLLILAISALVALALARPTARAIATPINRLADAARRLSRGELDAQVSVHAGGEVRTLVESFNSMATSMRRAELGRKEAMNVLRSTAAMLGDLRRGETDGSDGKADDERDLRRIADLIRVLISEREQRLDDLRVAKLEADNASQAKGDFLAMMSHEIRTPLNAVVGLAELLVGSELKEEQAQMARVMQSAGSHLQTIINDVLDFTKLQSGKFEIHQEVVEVPALIEAVLMMTRALGSSSGLDIRSCVSKDVPKYIKSDGSRITQILTNLLGNAVKFTREGEVLLNVCVNTDTSVGRTIDFIVSDTGPGIAPEDREKVFQPFKQSSSGRLSPKPGTGLGLTISRGLAEAMSGSLQLENPLRGAAFRLRLPLKEASPLGNARNGFNALPGGRALSILVAEDTPANQLVIRMLLTRMGHKPTIVENGRLAVELLQNTRFDLVILDLQMPEMNGFEAARAIRAAEPLQQRIPLMAFSAFTQDSEKELAIECGFDSFLNKPISLAELSEGIAAIVVEKQLPATA